MAYTPPRPATIIERLQKVVDNCHGPNSGGIYALGQLAKDALAEIVSLGGQKRALSMESGELESLIEKWNHITEDGIRDSIVKTLTLSAWEGKQIDMKLIADIAFDLFELYGHKVAE